MKKFLNVVIALSAISLLILLIFLFIESLNILKLFPFVVLSFMFLIASFTLKLFLSNNELPKLIQWGLVILSILPLSVPLIGLIDPMHVEANWPLMVAGLVFYSGVGLLSILGVFTKQNKPPLISQIFLVLFGLLLTLWFGFILVRVSDSQIYEYTFVFGAGATILYLIGLFLRLAKSK